MLFYLFNIGYRKDGIVIPHIKMPSSVASSSKHKAWCEHYCGYYEKTVSHYTMGGICFCKNDFELGADLTDPMELEVYKVGLLTPMPEGLSGPLKSEIHIGFKGSSGTAVVNKAETIVFNTVLVTGKF